MVGTLRGMRTTSSPSSSAQAMTGVALDLEPGDDAVGGHGEQERPEELRVVALHGGAVGLDRRGAPGPNSMVRKAS